MDHLFPPAPLARLVAGFMTDSPNGVPSLLAGVQAWERGAYGEALPRLEVAREQGLPAELLPHWYALYGCALVHLGAARQAAEVLRRGWAEYPDFAALPAFLGLAYAAAGDRLLAGRMWFAALVEDDPDGSLARYRPQLTRGLSLVQHDGETVAS